MATTKTQAAAMPPTTEKSTLHMIQLAKLRPGHELKDGSINARVHGRADIDSMEASIRQVGLVVALSVTALQDDGNHYVFAGNRRLAALRRIYGGGAKADEIKVPCVVRETEGVAALELSMIENTERRDIHPVDQFEVFAKMVADGVSIEDIGTRYLLKPQQVRQALALAAMAPEIRAAWRAGEVSDDAAEAFTQSPDHKHQVAVFDKLKRAKNLSEWQITNELGLSNHEIDDTLKFVGRAAYEKAGHQVNATLFSDAEDDARNVTLSSLPALKAMALAKIEARCAELVAAGWGWAIPAADQPKDIYSWRRLPHGNPDKDTRAKAGCTVAVGDNGSFNETKGYIKPGENVRVEKTPAQRKAATKAKETRQASGGLSNVLASKLADQITQAAAEVLAQEPVTALAMVVASLQAHGGPLGIEPKFYGQDDGEYHNRDFTRAFHGLLKDTPKDMMSMLAVLASATLNMSAHSAEGMPLGDANPEAAAVLNSLPILVLNEALREHFDYMGYFDGVSRDMIVQAVHEATGDEAQARAVGKMKKTEAVQAAVIAVDGTKWLPTCMRTRNYDGPTAKSTTKARPGKKRGERKPAKKKRKARR